MANGVATFMKTIDVPNSHWLVDENKGVFHKPWIQQVSDGRWYTSHQPKPIFPKRTVLENTWKHHFWEDWKKGWCWPHLFRGVGGNTKPGNSSAAVFRCFGGAETFPGVSTSMNGNSSAFLDRFKLTPNVDHCFKYIKINICSFSCRKLSLKWTSEFCKIFLMNQNPFFSHFHYIYICM